MMTVRVDLRKWGKSNLHYIIAWIVMGLVVFVIIVKTLGWYTLALIGPFLPYLILILARLRRELKKGLQKGLQKGLIK